MMSLALYQHSLGDFKVKYTISSGDHGEQHFMFDLGGAISFALGLIMAARQRGEEVELHVLLHSPRVNRGFAAGYASNDGRGSLPGEKMNGYDSHNRNPFFPSRGKELGGLSEEVEALLNSLSPRSS
jgi:hypothetical protein